MIAIDWRRPKDPRTPLGHASILVTLEAAGVDETPIVCHCNADDFDEVRVLADLAAAATTRDPHRTDVVIGTYIWNERIVQGLLRTLRERGFPGQIVLGGQQISYADSGLEALYPGADLFVRGPGERFWSRSPLAWRRRRSPAPTWAGRRTSRRRRRSTSMACRRPGSRRRVRPTSPASCAGRWRAAASSRARSASTATGLPAADAPARPEPHRGGTPHVRRRGVRDVAVLDPVFNLEQRAVDTRELIHRTGPRALL